MMPMKRPPKQTTKNLTMPRTTWPAVMVSIKLKDCITLYSTTVTPSETQTEQVVEVVMVVVMVAEVVKVEMVRLMI